MSKSIIDTAANLLFSADRANKKENAALLESIFAFGLLQGKTPSLNSQQIQEINYLLVSQPRSVWHHIVPLLAQISIPLSIEAFKQLTFKEIVPIIDPFSNAERNGKKPLLSKLYAQCINAKKGHGPLVDLYKCLYSLHPYFLGRFFMEHPTFNPHLIRYKDLCELYPKDLYRFLHSVENINYLEEYAQSLSFWPSWLFSLYKPARLSPELSPRNFLGLLANRPYFINQKDVIEWLKRNPTYTSYVLTALQGVSFVFPTLYFKIADELGVQVLPITSKKLRFILRRSQYDIIRQYSDAYITAWITKFPTTPLPEELTVNHLFSEAQNVRILTQYWTYYPFKFENLLSRPSIYVFHGQVKDGIVNMPKAAAKLQGLQLKLWLAGALSANGSYSRERMCEQLPAFFYLDLLKCLMEVFKNYDINTPPVRWSSIAAAYIANEAPDMEVAAEYIEDNQAVLPFPDKWSPELKFAVKKFKASLKK